MTKSGVKVMFDNKKCTVINKEGRSLTIGHFVNEKLYKVTSPSDAALISTCATASLSVWHERYGHMNMRDVSKISRDNSIVEGMSVSKNGESNESENPCTGCALGKMHRLPFPKLSQNRASKCLDLLHTDLCGPMHVESLSGSRYMLTFTDDFS